MISINGTVPLVNTKALINNFVIKGKNIDLLSMCNMQDFKYIDGCGEGYFLVNYGSVSGNTCVLSLTQNGTTISRTLLITDSYIIENSNTPTLQLLKTAELKYSLESVTATRNYNVIDIKSITGSAAATLAPDTTSKNIVQIINDILPTAVVVFDGTPFKPFNMFVDGLSLREILDNVCKAFGLLWTMELSNVFSVVITTIYIYKGTSIIPNTAIPNDVNIPYPLQSYKEISTHYSIIENGVQTPKNYATKSTASTGQKTYDVYNPYFPALLTPGTTTLINSATLDAVHAYTSANIAAIISLENYYRVFNNIVNTFLPSIAPRALKYTYGHNAQGLRTQLYSGVYPVLPMPEHNRSDRQATHVVGTIKYEYKGAVSGFFVNALYGLDGFITPNTELYVTNLYNWNYGALDAMVRIEWDAKNRRWIPLQQAYICPPAEDPDPLPPPPSPPTLEDIGFGV